MSKNIRKIIDTINVHEGYPFTYKVDFKLSMELVKIVTYYKDVIDPITKNTSWSIPVDTTIEDSIFGYNREKLDEHSAYKILYEVFSYYNGFNKEGVEGNIASIEGTVTCTGSGDIDPILDILKSSAEEFDNEWEGSIIVYKEDYFLIRYIVPSFYYQVYIYYGDILGEDNTVGSPMERIFEKWKGDND